MFDFFKKISDYSTEENEKYFEFLKKNFGENYEDLYPNSRLLNKYHISVNIVSPSSENPYYYIVTKGLANYNFESKYEQKYTNAELFIKLPNYWNPSDDNINKNWILSGFSGLLDYIIKSKVSIIDSCSISFPGIDPNKKFNSFLLADDSLLLELSEEKKVGFVKVLALTDDEIKLKNSSIFFVFTSVINEIETFNYARKSITETDEWLDSEAGCLDYGENHSTKVKNNKFDVNYGIEEIQGYNHIAAFLRFMVKNDFTNEFFNSKFASEVEKIKNDDESFDLRLFIKEDLLGNLPYLIFNLEGGFLANYLYVVKEYPAFIDKYAINYFQGKDVAYMNTEEYLFVPYDKAYLDATYDFLSRLLEEKRQEK